MRRELQAQYPDYFAKVKFYIGDVRNLQLLKDAMHGVDYTFHVAALKEVPSCEFFPMEAVRSNIIGTDNVIHAATENHVKNVVFLSTHGEKLYETLMICKERLRSEDMGNYYRVAADSCDLNYDKFVVQGNVKTMADESYTSHNTRHLDVQGTVDKIMTTDYIKEQLANWGK